MMFNFALLFFKVVFDKTRRLADVLDSQAPAAQETFRDFLSQHDFGKDFSSF
jgi:hypothetical protein